MAGGPEIPASAGASRRLRAMLAAFSLGALLAVVIGVVVLVGPSLPPAMPEAEARSQAGASGVGPLSGVPRATAGFVSAYGHGDAAAINQVASPLYFVEWTRRGVSFSDQVALFDTHQRTSSGEWLLFSYATGFVDGRGFGHYLYVGRPITTGITAVPSVWRVDADGEGRVIWIELVWLFSKQMSEVTAVPPGSAPVDSPVRSRIAARSSDVMFGVAADDGVEGFYGVEQSADGNANSARRTVLYFAVDGDGGLRPGAWTYGERIPNRPLAGRLQLQPDQAKVLSAYLASIR